jgi:hypothetical protein
MSGGSVDDELDNCDFGRLLDWIAMCPLSEFEQERSGDQEILLKEQQDS